MPRKKKEILSTVPRTVMGVVVDASGSMQSKASETVAGYNDWLAEQQKLPDDAVLVRTLFNNSARVEKAEYVKISQPLTFTSYRPGGFTALYDAVMATIKAMESIAKSGDRFLVLIITDGWENASTHYAIDDVREAILTRTRTGNWTFAYQGCEADAWGQAESIGIAAGNFAGYANSGIGTQSAFARTAGATVAYRGSVSGQSTSFHADGNDAADLTTPHRTAKI